MNTKSQGRDQNLQTIREACIKANPEIEKKVCCYSDLPMGECGRGRKKGCTGVHCKCMQSDCSNMHFVECFEHYIHAENVKGRPIHLADVLVAIGKFYTKEVCVGNDGSFCVGDSPKRAFWNLRADTLEAQSDECLEFLANLLA